MTLEEFWQLVQTLEREYDGKPGGVTLLERISAARSEAIETARDYVDARTFRADVVTTIPASAPAGYLMVKAGDTNLYVGTGPGNPLRRIPTVAL